MAAIAAALDPGASWRSRAQAATSNGANTLSTGITAIDTDEDGTNFDIDVSSTDTITIGAFTRSTSTFAFTSSGTATATFVITYRPAVIR